MPLFPIRLPSGPQLGRAAKGLLAVLLMVGGLAFSWHAAHRQTAQLVRGAGVLAQAEHARQADSAAAYTAGRLYQQRLDADKLRHEDETHDKSRPAAGPIELPDFYPTR